MNVVANPYAAPMTLSDSGLFTNDPSTGVAAGGAEARGDRGTGKETELHQAPGVVAGKIDRIEDPDIAAAEVHQRRGKAVSFETARGAVIDTQLHLEFSMLASEMLVNTRNGDPCCIWAIFSRHGSNAPFWC